MSSFRESLKSRQLERLRHLLATVRESNPFYRNHLSGTPAPESESVSLENFGEVIPVTTKDLISADQIANPPFGSNLSFPLRNYVRFHQTSGSTGKPIRWLDTVANWQSMLESWKMVFNASGVRQGDRVFFAFSFGPFLGFWTAFEAAQQLDLLSIPGGGMSTSARLKAIFDTSANVLCCTPTYAIHLGQSAANTDLDIKNSPVRHIIVAGEPGGSLPTVRSRIEALWPGAVVHDHHGMTEVGPVTFPCPTRPNTLRVYEENFLAEIVNPDSLMPVRPGETGELLLTTLTRTGSPLIRYRTGDLVCAVAEETDPSDYLGLDGGIIGRADDMVIIRGVNIFPSAVDALIRRFPQVEEYQVTVDESRPMTEISILAEFLPDEYRDSNSEKSAIQSLEAELREHFNLRIPVTRAKTGSLPRFEMKSRRWIRVR